MADRRAKKLTYAPQAARTQFVFVKPCGCPIGLVEGSYAKTEEYVKRFYAGMSGRCSHA